MNKSAGLVYERKIRWYGIRDSILFISLHFYFDEVMMKIRLELRRFVVNQF